MFTLLFVGVGIFSICGATFLSSVLSYSILERYDYKVLFIVSFLLIFFSGNEIIGLLLNIICSTILTAISVYIYNKTDSFWNFFRMQLLFFVILCIPILASYGQIGYLGDMVHR